jgi:hypothetical protein
MATQEEWLHKNGARVHSETIQKPWLFPRQPYSKIDSIVFPPSPHQYSIMVEQKQVCIHFCTFLKNKKKRKYYIYKSIQTLYSVLCWSTFGSDYSLVLGVTLSLAHLYFGSFSPFSADPLKLILVGWRVSLHSYFQVSPDMFDQV